VAGTSYSNTEKRYAIPSNGSLASTSVVRADISLSLRASILTVALTPGKHPADPTKLRSRSGPTGCWTSCKRLPAMGNLAVRLPLWRTRFLREDETRIWPVSLAQCVDVG